MKLGTCTDCQKNSDFSVANAPLVPIIAGKCPYHYKIYRAKVCAERKKDRNKVASLVKPDDTEKINLVYWYSARMKECTGRCAECRQPIAPFDRHSSIAHVLPKRKEYGFPSVATHPLNFIELGTRCGCHNRYDLSWLSASKMKIFPLAVEIAVKIYPLLTHAEQARFPEVFEPYLKKEGDVTY